MTDDRKRLPIYIDTDERVGDGPYLGWPTQWGDAVLYVPAPATCATCPSFRTTTESLIEHWCVELHGLLQPTPESWCSYHPDNQRATEGTKR